MGIRRVNLSSTTNGRWISVPNIYPSITGSIVHTVSASARDEIWLYAINNATASRDLHWRASNEPFGSELFYGTVQIRPNVGPLQILEGMLMTSGTLRVMMASGSDDINVGGWVNRITY